MRHINNGISGTVRFTLLDSADNHQFIPVYRCRCGVLNPVSAAFLLRLAQGADRRVTRPVIRVKVQRRVG
ncbi:hypothetical protein D3C80_1509700 [compost metagenome]